MTDSMELAGLDGATPLGYLAAVGLLYVVSAAARSTRKPSPALTWVPRGTWIPVLHSAFDMDEVAQVVLADSQSASVRGVLDHAYPKLENDKRQQDKVVKKFYGLRPPVGVLRAWLTASIESKDAVAIDLLSALMLETATEAIKPESQPNLVQVGVAVDMSHRDALERSATQTAFDFTSKNQQFLDQARRISAAFDQVELVKELLGSSPGVETDRTLGWDPREDKPGAIFPARPNPLRYPALEWLAFRALPMFPLAGTGELARTTSCGGRRKSGTFRWCLWSHRATLETLRALHRTIFVATAGPVERKALGITEVFESGLTKGADGYSGIFAPPGIA